MRATLAGLATARRVRWARRVGIAVVVLVVLFGLVGAFVAPGVIRTVAEQQIAGQTGRKATIGAVELSPYRLAATVRDFRLYEPDGTTVALQVDELVANVSSASLFKRALVFDQLRIVHPQLAFARLDAQRFSFSDIVDRVLAKPKSDDETRFSINNIEVEGGRIAFDDRPARRTHLVEDLRLGIPFVSNLPYDADLFVTPAFSARVDGSTIALAGKAQPFSSTRETAIELDVAGLDVPSLLDFAPTKLPLKVASGTLATKLAIRFRAAGKDADGKAVPQTLSIAGSGALDDLKLVDDAGRGPISWKRLVVEADALEPFANAYAIRSITVASPRIEATRRKDGSIDLATLFAPTSAAPSEPAAKPAAAAAPPRVTIASLRVDAGTFAFSDETFDAVERFSFERFAATVEHLSLVGDAPTAYAVSIATPEGGAVETRGAIVLSRRSVDGEASIKGFRPGAFSRYLATFLAARIGDGSIDASAHYVVDASRGAPTGRIDRIDARIDKLRSLLPNEQTPFVAADAIVLVGGAFDFATRAFTADALRFVAPTVAVVRDAKGRINLLGALVEQKTSERAPPTAAVVVQPDDAPAFSATIRSFAVERGNLSFDDASTGTPVRVRASPFDLKAENVGTSTSATVPFSIDATVDRGRLAIRGKTVVAPLAIDATIDATRVPVGWLAAYAGSRLNVVVESADLDAKGTLRVEAPKAAPAAQTTGVAYRGSLGLSRVRALDRVTSEEFVRLKKLDVPTLAFAMPAPNAPFSATLGPVALDDFYVRIIVNANGRLNLQDVVAGDEGTRSVTTPEDAASDPGRRPAVERARNRATAAVVPAPPSGPKALVRVAGVKLGNGRVGITDNFVKPNYSANLTALAGEVSAIDSTGGKPADLRLTGTIDGDGALVVSGRVDPFAFTSLTDISAEAKDIELTRLTPYAVKYAGYAIERGKLSMTVKYRIENGKLDAQNRLFLDQLTFGQRVESPTATKLPVLLAVSLLKNSRGEIDVNLPISGSLSDPEFSVGGVIVRVLLNLLSRAVTSPFALLGSAFGSGGGGELGYVEFEAGVSDVTPEGKRRLETLAKALADRPALKLDIIGRYDPASDPAGIKRDKLLDRLKDLKAKDLSKGGERVGRGDVTIAAGERDALLARVYDDTKLPDKPRNAIGIAKAVPPAEMERLLLDDIKLGDDDPRWLAEARADVVRHFIEDTGKVPASRVFLVAPRLDASGIAEGRPNRVDFALR